MARSSFGASQDLSQVFASFYAQYSDRLETSALRAAREAEEQQAATDNDTIDRWQQGELTDEEFLAYAQERIAATASDPERNAYWKRVQRDTQKSIQADEISDTAEDLINQIEAGTKTWDDLLNFYKDSQKSLRPSDPLFKDLEKQIEQVNDRIRDNKIAGEFERVQYQFEANQISGKDAGAQLRKMAEQFRSNDPAKYYQILQQALDLERFGGFYASGSGGGSGSSSSGSGRGSSTKAINQTIDALQGMRDRIGSLSEQFEDGVRIGSITVENADGSLSTEEVLLQNPDGTPSEGMQSLDGQMIETLNRLEQAYIEKGDRSAAGGVANYRMQYITEHVQPRNTIGPEQQAASLLQTGLSLVEQAADSDDPVLAWNTVQQWAKRVADWESRVNATVTRARQPIPEGVDDTTRFATSSSQNPIEGQTTGEFANQVAGLREFAEAVASGDAAAASMALESFAPGASDISERVSAAIDLVVGIPTGKYVRAYIPGVGLVYAPVAPTYSTEIGPDGQPQTVLRSVPVLPNGNPIFDASKGEELVDVMVQIGGRAQMVKGVASPSFFVNGQAVSESDYRAAQRASEKPSAEKPTLQEFRSLLVPGRDGTPAQNWIYDAAQGLWYKNRVTTNGGVPMVFIGKDARLAQQVADKLGIDSEGSSYFDFKAESMRKAHQQRPAGGAAEDWYSNSSKRARQAARTRTAQSFREGQSLLGGFANTPLISQALKAMGAQLGIRSFDTPSAPTKLPAPTQLRSGLLETADLGPALPRITLPTIKPTTTALPRLTLPPPRPSIASGLTAPRTTTTTSPTRTTTTRPSTTGFLEGF